MKYTKKDFSFLCRVTEQLLNKDLKKNLVFPDDEGQIQVDGQDHKSQLNKEYMKWRIALYKANKLKPKTNNQNEH